MFVRSSLALLVLFVGVARGAPTQPSAPLVERHGTATQLVVDGKPFLSLAGELRNSSAAVLPISRELLEAEEGRFDFTLVEGLIAQAREHRMKLILLWFGSWKNGLSSYRPLWVKTDPNRFPLARDAKGTPLDILSTFGKGDRDGGWHRARGVDRARAASTRPKRCSRCRSKTRSACATTRAIDAMPPTAPSSRLSRAS